MSSQRSDNEDGQVHSGPKDDRLKPVKDGESVEEPKIYGIALHGSADAGRREFLTRASGAAGLAALGQVLAACGDSDYRITANEQTCTCHVVCGCDSQGGGQGQNNTSTYQGTVCTCDTVCTCNTVCTCDSQGGGGGGSYWYPN